MSTELTKNDSRLERHDPLLLSSELRQLMLEVRPALARALFEKKLSDDRQYLGEESLPVFFSDIRKILSI